MKIAVEDKCVHESCYGAKDGGFEVCASHRERCAYEACQELREKGDEYCTICRTASDNLTSTPTSTIAELNAMMSRSHVKYTDIDSLTKHLMGAPHEIKVEDNQCASGRQCVVPGCNVRRYYPHDFCSKECAINNKCSTKGCHELRMGTTHSGWMKHQHKRIQKHEIQYCYECNRARRAAGKQEEEVQKVQEEEV